MVMLGKRSSLLWKNKSVSTFTNEYVQHEPFHIDSLYQFLRRISRTITTIVKVFTYLISVDVRLLESRITTVRIDTIDARSVRSARVHTAIVNTSTLVDGRNAHWLRSVF